MVDEAAPGRSMSTSEVLSGIARATDPARLLRAAAEGARDLIGVREASITRSRRRGRAETYVARSTDRPGESGWRS